MMICRVKVILLFLLLAMSMAGRAVAVIPSGWLYHSERYVYSPHETSWYYLNAADEQWVVNISSGQWGHMEELEGWMYYNWPYAYSSDLGEWMWFNQIDRQWCLRISDSEWSVLGLPLYIYPVDGGTFWMGDTFLGVDGDANEQPIHQVTLSSYNISKYEITNAQMRDALRWAYEQGKLTVSPLFVRNNEGAVQDLMDFGDLDCEISWDGSNFVVESGKENLPCRFLPWYGAVAYCNYRSIMEGRSPCYDMADWTCNFSAKGYRLPTEAEWEFAARGGANGGNTLYSGSANVADVAWYQANSGGEPHPVGQKQFNELGLHDMSGNVWEWCNDWYADYSDSAITDPVGPATGSTRVLRGGWWAYRDFTCRVCMRTSMEPADNVSYEGMGFRVVLEE